MKYVAARKAEMKHPTTGETITNIVATDEQGVEYWISDIGSDVPPWPEFLASGGTIDAATPAVDPVPPVISDRQFFQQLAMAGLITEAEALAAVQTGTLPAAILTYIDRLPVEQRFPAKMLLTGATQFERANPLVDAFGAMYGMDKEQIDDLWRVAAAL